jgi:peptidoglycan-N-acetylglucosamine deacetylase
VTAAVALTYDDGPHGTWTPRVLETLRRHGARATFFVLARRAAEHRDLVGRMLAEGHEVGFHALDHVRHSQRSREGLDSDLRIGLGMLAEAGVRPRAWRAPWGVETEVTRELAAARGLRLWGWNVDTHDWRGDPAGMMFGAFERQGGLRGGDVVLMHDGLGPGARRDDCAETVELTRLLLARAEDENLVPTPVSECAGVLA